MSLTKTQKYDLINSCESIEDLEQAIILLCNKKGMINGRARTFNGRVMSSYVKGVVSGELPPNLLTRAFGIRQQAFYIKHYQN